MQSVSSFLNRAVLVVAGALALGACSRAEYAMLPKSPAYLGTKPAAAVASRPATPAPVAPAASPAPEAVAPASPAPVVAAAPAAKAAPAKVASAAPASEVAVVARPEQALAAAPAQPKLNLAQRLLLNKTLRKLDKHAQKMSARSGDNTASTAQIDGKLRYAIIFGAISLIFFVIGGTVGNLIGSILLIIGILFLLFWLLDNL